MEPNLAETDLHPFSTQVFTSESRNKVVHDITMKLVHSYFMKLFGADMEIGIPPASCLKVDYRIYAKSAAPYHWCDSIGNQEGGMKRELLVQMVAWSTFGLECVDLSHIESILGESHEKMRDLNEDSRLKKVFRIKDKVMNAKQQALYMKLPQPLIACLDFYNRRSVLYLYSVALPAYLMFSREHKETILEQFQQEHDQILRAFCGILKPIKKNGIPEMTYCSDEICIIGMYYGESGNKELSEKDIDWNFFVCFYVLEKLLAKADSLFGFYGMR